MFIETWRWRIVVLLIGLALLATGGYCLLHPQAVPLNICQSRTSAFLQHLNTVLSVLAYGAIAISGSALVYLVGHSVRKGLEIEDERKPVDYREAAKTAVAYVALIAALALCIYLSQHLLRGTNLDPNLPQDHLAK